MTQSIPHSYAQDVDTDRRDSIRAKLERGDWHLRALHEPLERFAHSGWGFRPEYDDQGRTVVRFALKKEIPLEFGLIVGDYVHNLRSALDYLVCGFVPTHTRRTMFPICRDAGVFERNVASAARRGRGPLAGLNPEESIFELIESVQPYHEDGSHATRPLRILANLDNEDKHRAILARAGAFARRPVPIDDITGEEDIVAEGTYFMRVNTPLEDGEVVMSSDVKGEDDPRLGTFFALTFDMMFGRREPIASRDLVTLRDTVGAVIERGIQLDGLGEPS